MLGTTFLLAIRSIQRHILRSFLTILGIVIGVATVMTMAAAITGLRGSVMSAMEGLGPNNFIVNRFDQTKLMLVNDAQAPPWEGKPAITFAEAEMLEALPSIRSVVTAADAG